MHFHLEQWLDAPVDEVEAAFVDVDFLAELRQLPNVGEPELLSQDRSDGRVDQRVRYRFTGSLSPAVQRVLDPQKLVWVEESSYDLRGHTATFRVVPEHYANRLRCAGTYRFAEVDGRTHRFIDGDMSVSYPLVGRVVERAIVSGLENHLGEEADLLRAWLSRR